MTDIEMILTPGMKHIALEAPDLSLRVATAEEQIGDVVVRLEVLRSRDGSLRVDWPDAVEVPADVRAGVETEVLYYYNLEEELHRERTANK